MLSKDFGVLIIIAGIISVPLVWFSVVRWLENYAYRTEISWWVFVIPLFVLATIVIVTVGQQAIKAALINPIKSLKQE